MPLRDELGARRRARCRARSRRRRPGPARRSRRRRRCRRPCRRTSRPSDARPRGVELGDEAVAERRALVVRRQRLAEQVGAGRERARDRDAIAARGDALTASAPGPPSRTSQATLAARVEARDEAVAVAGARRRPAVADPQRAGERAADDRRRRRSAASARDHRPLGRVERELPALPRRSPRRARPRRARARRALRPALAPSPAIAPRRASPGARAGRHARRARRATRRASPRCASIAVVAPRRSSAAYGALPSPATPRSDAPARPISIVAPMRRARAGDAALGRRQTADATQSSSDATRSLRPRTRGGSRASRRGRAARRSPPAGRACRCGACRAPTRAA